MVQINDQERLKPWMGVVFFCIGLAFLIFCGSFMQSKWGIPGLIATELGLLAISLLFCLIRKVKISEVFPIRKPTGMDILGILFLTAGGFLLNLLCLGISLLFVKGGIDHISDLSSFLYGDSMSALPLLLVLSALPAICEEAFNRGAVLSCFRSLKKDWQIVLIIGIFFGIFHLDPLRFLNTACLGAILAYIMVKKNNILLPMLVHFTNNAISAGMGLLAKSVAGGAAQMAENSAAALNASKASLVGSYMLFSCLAPILLVTGAMFLDRESHKAKRYFIALIISGVLFWGGIIITLVNTYTGMNGALLNWNYTYVVDEENYGTENLAQSEIDVTEEKAYTIVAVASAKNTDISFRIYDENGTAVVDKTSKGNLIVSQALTLKPGHYKLAFEAGRDIIGKQFTYQVMVR